MKYNYGAPVANKKGREPQVGEKATFSLSQGRGFLRPWTIFLLARHVLQTEDMIEQSLKVPPSPF